MSVTRAGGKAHVKSTGKGTFRDYDLQEVWLNLAPLKPKVAPKMEALSPGQGQGVAPLSACFTTRRAFMAHQKLHFRTTCTCNSCPQPSYGSTCFIYKRGISRAESKPTEDRQGLPLVCTYLWQTETYRLVVFMQQA